MNQRSVIVPPVAPISDRLRVPIGLLNDLGRSQSQAEILRTYSQWSKHVCSADSTAIALVDGPDHLSITAVDGTVGVAEGERARIEGTLIGRAYLEMTPLIINDLASQPYPGCQALAKKGLDTTIMAPLNTADRCFGVATAHYNKGRRFTDDEFEILKAVAGCLATHVMIVDQMENLSRMASTDALTGARNRYHLYEEAKLVWNDWKAFSMPFSFVTIDIDHFKRINDTYGHDVGDAVLCTVVDRLNSRCRNADSVVRTGGEEFGILMQSTTQESAINVSQRLKHAVSDQPVSVRGVKLDITASLGVTEAHADDKSYADVFKRADEALYAAKEFGRDRVVVAQGDALSVV